MKYQITRRNGSLPKQLRVSFMTYEGVRSALRKYLRYRIGGWKRSQHPPLELAPMFGLKIVKVINK